MTPPRYRGEVFLVVAAPVVESAFSWRAGHTLVGVAEYFCRRQCLSDVRSVTVTVSE